MAGVKGVILFYDAFAIFKSTRDLRPLKIVDVLDDWPTFSGSTFWNLCFPGRRNGVSPNICGLVVMYCGRGRPLLLCILYVGNTAQVFLLINQKTFDRISMNSFYICHHFIILALFYSVLLLCGPLYLFCYNRVTWEIRKVPFVITD